MLIRKASIADSKQILEWRNDVVTRKNSFSNHMISDYEHENWIRSALMDSRYFIFMIEYNFDNIAVVIFEEENENIFKISVNLNPLYRGKRLARDVLLLAQKNFVQSINQNLEIENLTLKAKIMSHNLVSKKLFKSVNYKLVVFKPNYIIMEKTLILSKKT